MLSDNYLFLDLEISKDTHFFFKPTPTWGPSLKRILNLSRGSQTAKRFTDERQQVIKKISLSLSAKLSSNLSNFILHVDKCKMCIVSIFLVLPLWYLRHL